ncbi:MAG: efflux RND transporter periplasmic adaptor subunit [Bacteroidia bacterium]
MKLKYIIYAVLILGLSALVFYRIKANKERDAGAAMSKGGGKPGGQMPPTRVNGVVLKPQDFANSLQVTGSIEADEQVEIRSEVSGMVRSINFQEGKKVSKGQVLVKIDDSELRAQLLQAQTKQNLASENERRARLLLKKEAISQEEYDVASSEFRSAQAQTQLINAQLAKTIIRAPFSGTIGLRSISEGAYISPQTLITNLVSTDPIKITLSVPEKYASQVKVNTELTFTVAGSRKEYKATVYALEPGIESTTRTLQLKARARNPDNELLPGSFANITLPLSVMKEALLVPTEAVIPIQDGKMVFVSENGKAKEVKIETATRTDKDILVMSGLKAGDTVLTTGIMSLKPKAPVKVNVTNK